MATLPTLQQAVDICRSEESARQNVRELDGQSVVSRVPVYQKRRDKAAAQTKGPKLNVREEATYERRDLFCGRQGVSCV